VFMNLNAGAIGIRIDLEGAIALAKKHGFAGVDFSITEAARLGEQRGVDALRTLFIAAGIRPGSFGLPVEWRGDEARWREGLQQLPRLAELAAALGCQRCVTWVPPASDERPFDENVRFHVARFRPIAETLGQAGCRLGLEFIGPATSRRGRTYEFIHTMDGMLELCRAIGTGNAGLLLDCWHWYTSHGTLDDLRQLTNDDIVAVHLNDAPAGIPVDEQIDNRRCLPMETGVIDVPGFLRVLNEVGYDGPVTVEPFNERVRALAADQACAETAAALRKAFQAAGIG
jgi:sugar phosphate isomerase/epimerase